MKFIGFIQLISFHCETTKDDCKLTNDDELMGTVTFIVRVPE